MEQIMRRVVTLLCLLCCGVAVLAAATASWVPAPNGDGKWVRLENACLRLDLDPQVGARGAALIDKATGKNWLFGHDAREGAGLFMDHFWEQNWPGELIHAPYAAEIVPTTDGTATARFTITATGKWGGSTAPLLNGLQLTRTVTLMPDSPVLTVKVQVHNPTPTGKVMGYWMQNVLWAGGDREHDRYLRPNARNVSRVGWDWATKTPIVGFMESDFERNPTAGWTAVVDEEQHKGLVFLMDYGPLMFLYNCLQNTTVEWQYLQAAIPPGKTWETTVTAALPAKLDHLVHATPEALFNATFTPGADGLAIGLEATRLDRPVTAVRFTPTVLKLVSRTETPLPAVTVNDLDFTPKRAVVTLPGAFTEQIALKVDARLTLAGGETRDAHFEVFYGGNLGFAGINRTIDIPPMYALPAQPKQLTFLKPDSIARLRRETPRVLCVTGRSGEVWGADAAAAAWPAQVMPSAVAEASSIAANLTYWPVEYADLMSYDAIVLANVDVAALGVLGQEMLRDYVLHGGGLVVLGGMYTLGNGHVAGSRIADLLPVEPGKPFEIRPLATKVLTATDPAFAAFAGKGVTIAHTLTLRPGAQAVVSAGAAPILVTGTAGQGRVAVLGATPLGTLPAGVTPLWKAQEWPLALQKVIRWTAQR
jgi:hypothetical protein